MLRSLYYVTIAGYALLSCLITINVEAVHHSRSSQSSFSHSASSSRSSSSSSISGTASSNKHTDIDEKAESQVLGIATLLKSLYTGTEQQQPDWSNGNGLITGIIRGSICRIGLSKHFGTSRCPCQYIHSPPQRAIEIVFNMLLHQKKIGQKYQHISEMVRSCINDLVGNTSMQDLMQQWCQGRPLQSTPKNRERTFSALHRWYYTLQCPCNTCDEDLQGAFAIKLLYDISNTESYDVLLYNTRIQGVLDNIEAVVFAELHRQNCKCLPTCTPSTNTRCINPLPLTPAINNLIIEQFFQKVEPMFTVKLEKKSHQETDLKEHNDSHYLARIPHLRVSVIIDSLRQLGTMHYIGTKSCPCRYFSPFLHNENFEAILQETNRKLTGTITMYEPETVITPIFAQAVLANKKLKSLMLSWNKDHSKENKPLPPTYGYHYSDDDGYFDDEQKSGLSFNQLLQEYTQHYQAGCTLPCSRNQVLATISNLPAKMSKFQHAHTACFLNQMHQSYHNTILLAYRATLQRASSRDLFKKLRVRRPYGTPEIHKLIIETFPEQFEHEKMKILSTFPYNGFLIELMTHLAVTSEPESTSPASLPSNSSSFFSSSSSSSSSSCSSSCTSSSLSRGNNLPKMPLTEQDKKINNTPYHQKLQKHIQTPEGKMLIILKSMDGLGILPHLGTASCPCSNIGELLTTSGNGKLFATLIQRGIRAFFTTDRGFMQTYNHTIGLIDHCVKQVITNATIRSCMRAWLPQTSPKLSSSPFPQSFYHTQRLHVEHLSSIYQKYCIVQCQRNNCLAQTSHMLARMITYNTEFACSAHELMEDSREIVPSALEAVMKQIPHSPQNRQRATPTIHEFILTNLPSTVKELIRLKNEKEDLI